MPCRVNLIPRDQCPISGFSAAVICAVMIPFTLPNSCRVGNGIPEYTARLQVMKKNPSFLAIDCLSSPKK